MEVPPGLELVEDVSVAGWVDVRLLPPGGVPGAVLVGEVVPTGFEAYARVFHPFSREVEGAQVEERWADVSARRGTTAHPQMQLPGILGSSQGSRPGGSLLPPLDGELPERQCRALARVLAPFATTDRCLICIWEGFGWWNEGASYAPLTARRARWRERRHARRGARARQRELERVPKLRIRPDPEGGGAFRSYLLFRGPLATVPDIRIGGWRRSPQLWWPEDRAWIVASEIDGPSTYVGGSRACIDAVLGAPDLEALPSDVRHRFDVDGDLVNRPATAGP